MDDHHWAEGVVRDAVGPRPDQHVVEEVGACWATTMRSCAQSSVFPESFEPSIAAMLDGLIARSTETCGAALPLLKQAIAAVRREGLSIDGAGSSWVMYLTALNLFEWEENKQLAEELAQVARETGALAALPFALTYLAA
jgi:hypothetical protein